MSFIEDWTTANMEDTNVSNENTWNQTCCNNFLSQKRMILCDKCNIWFHETCLIKKYNVDRKVISGFFEKNNNEEYICPTCVLLI